MSLVHQATYDYVAGRFLLPIFGTHRTAADVVDFRRVRQIYCRRHHVGAFELETTYGVRKLKGGISVTFLTGHTYTTHMQIEH